MPELPEVETICRGIRPHLLGRRIEHVSHSGKTLRCPVPLTDMESYTTGRMIIDLHRRAKYILTEFDNGSLLIFHLGMTGNLGLFTPQLPPGKHCHLQFLLDDGMELRYTDIRRFGSIQVIAPSEAITLETTFFRTTGPEPFSETFNEEYLHNLARNRSIPVKAFIMTNQVVAGVGNIYANESLFKAGISPRRKANRISRSSWKRLVTAVREVLTHAIACGGSTINDYVNADQENGYFQINFQVYGRQGEWCKECKAVIQKVVIGGRASYYCPQCQK